jgi:bifunctional non-homologous end joining protein LigD
VPLKTYMPHHVKPMLATLVAKPFDRDDWFFEVKWDGFRAIAEIEAGRIRLYSRNQKSFADRFAPIVRELEKIPHDAVLDGEIVVLDEQGVSQFQLLQNYRSGRGLLAYYVFDLLYLDGDDLRSAPLRQRKKILANLIPRNGVIRYSDHIERDGIAFFKAATERHLEGIVAKKATSVYQQGQRGTQWLKIKAQKQQEAVIAGFTEPRGSRLNLGALILAVHEGKDLTYIGHASGRLDTKALKEMRLRLEALEQSECPLKTKPKPNAPVHWVKPQLVCEVAFQEWTSDGRMRQPIFLGLRDDKDPTTVTRELPRPL